jgi:2-keto-3-deoxy-L-rhamnonate aldolase RhmA
MWFRASVYSVVAGTSASFCRTAKRVAKRVQNSAMIHQWRLAQRYGKGWKQTHSRASVFGDPFHYSETNYMPEREDTQTRSPVALARLRLRLPVFGILQTIPNATLTEMALWSGYDFVILDCEHGVVDEQAHLACLRVISGSQAFSVVRVRPGDIGAVGRYLDFGADGIMLPGVQTAADAAGFVAAATHGPVGTRSSTGSGSRAARYGLHDQAAGERPLLLAMIEGKQAVANIAAIVATPGLDGLVIGPYDLSADLGCPYDYSSPAYNDAFVRIEQAATGARLLLGTAAHAGFPVERLLGSGHCFILASVDIFALRDGYRSHLEAARKT